jgi:hypothetical protein
MNDRQGRIEARVLDLANEPVRGAMIIIVAAPDDLVDFAAISDVDGFFTFERLTPGFYRLRVLAEGHGTIERTLEVAAGETVDVDLTLVA